MEDNNNNNNICDDCSLGDSSIYPRYFVIRVEPPWLLRLPQVDYPRALSPLSLQLIATRPIPTPAVQHHHSISTLLVLSYPGSSSVPSVPSCCGCCTLHAALHARCTSRTGQAVIALAWEYLYFLEGPSTAGSEANGPCPRSFFSTARQLILTPQSILERGVASYAITLLHPFLLSRPVPLHTITYHDHDHSAILLFPPPPYSITPFSQAEGICANHTTHTLLCILHA